MLKKFSVGTQGCNREIILKLKGTYIIQVGNSYYVAEISGAERFSGLSINRESEFMQSLEECEEFCFKMGLLSKNVISEDYLEELKEVSRGFTLELK